MIPDNEKGVRMRRAVIGLILLLSANLASARPFSFVAYGDTAYMLPRDTSRVERLIDAINLERPAFTIHVGDFKGYTSCSDAAYDAHRATFQRHGHGVVVTPGDNDWFDCNVESAGGFDPLERLASLRRMFFGTDSGLGSRPLRLQRQNGLPENARWSHAGIVFATVHVIGPHNGFVRDAPLATDAVARSRAGEAWVREAFRTARQAKAPALVLAFQADPWLQSAPMYENGPLDWLRTAIGEESARFPGQVLVIHGDSHRLVVDTPYRRPDIDRGTTSGMNVTRLQVPGWPDHRAVKIEVDTGKPAMFTFGVVMTSDEASGAQR